VLIQHASIAAFISAFNNKLQLSPADRVFQFFAITFDGSLAEVFGALTSGATLLLWTPPDFITPAEQLGATVMLMTASALAAVPLGSLPRRLRVLGTGGEALPLELVKAWRPYTQLFVNCYGERHATGLCIAMRLNIL
jgi:non-ribosomal peptide synthetase component F